MSHFDNVVGAIREGEVIPFFGAGLNLFGREEKPDYQPGQYLPSGRELSQYLANRYPGYPSADKNDLSRVSQYVSLILGSRSLYNRLGEIFDVDYPITRLHTFFARLPKVLRAKGHKRPYQLIVTTNYDDVLERAFRDEGEPYDLVTYVATKPDVGKFRHIPHNGHVRDSELITQPNEYLKLPFKGLMPTQTVILKIHGMVERAGNRLESPNAQHDSFVITEDDYIDYLAQSDLSGLVPVQLKQKLTNSSFLFLGYGLRDWNLRVIMHRLWRDQRLNSTSWAVQKEVDELDQKFWETHKVNLVQSTLENYIDELEKALFR
jgi:hypothetical protein